MRKLFLSAGGFLVLAGAVVLAHGPALAAPLDDLDREKAQLQKENADLRVLLRMREENAGLLRRLGQTRVEAPAPLPVAQGPRVKAAAPVSSGETLRTEPAPGRVPPSVFESYAADMPVKGPAPMRAVYNWTGFYVGGNIGYSIGNGRVSQVLNSLSTGIVDTQFTDSAVAPKGVLGGVQVGYNWQATRNWLVGFETDFQAANQTDKACTLSCVASGGITETVTVEQKLEYFGTVRARLGIVNDNVLFYATGGAAYGRVVQTAAVAITAPPPTGASFLTNTAGETRFGWAAGGGIEAALWGNWTAKAEYLYVNLGDMKPNVLIGTAAGLPISLVTSSTIRDHVVRAGINYRFGDAPMSAYASARGPDAYAAYTPVYNWTGFYVGANAGYGQGVSRLSQGTPTDPLSSTFDSVIAPKGFAGGVQIGYNFQGGRNWLVGFEADIQGTNQSDTACAPIICFSQTAPGAAPLTEAMTAKEQIDWFGTVRGRVGVVNNNILFYGTGGVAFGSVKQTIADNFIVGGGAGSLASVASTFNQVGWTAGGGIEAAVWGNWTAKAEYLYLDLGSIKSVFTTAVLFGGTLTNTSTVRDHIFRAGVNYRFGEPGPVVAKY
jgi:outer membrane immunogenic protein